MVTIIALHSGGRIATEELALRRLRVYLCRCMYVRVGVYSSVAIVLVLVTNCVLMHRSMILNPHFHLPLVLCLAFPPAVRGLPDMNSNAVSSMMERGHTWTWCTTDVV